MSKMMMEFSTEEAARRAYSQFVQAGYDTDMPKKVNNHPLHNHKKDCPAWRISYGITDTPPRFKAGDMTKKKRKKSTGYTWD
jgi:hypothetical protein